VREADHKQILFSEEFLEQGSPFPPLFVLLGTLYTPVPHANPLFKDGVAPSSSV
jgi:hypothetical protein